jgi:hypothetical protein
MKTHDTLAELESPVAEKAVHFSVGAVPADEMIDQIQETFQRAGRWGKPLADRPTPDDWPDDD